jgi:hypothetical protein
MLKSESELVDQYLTKLAEWYKKSFKIFCKELITIKKELEILKNYRKINENEKKLDSESPSHEHGVKKFWYEILAKKETFDKFTKRDMGSIFLMKKTDVYDKYEKFCEDEGLEIKGTILFWKITKTLIKFEFENKKVFIRGDKKNKKKVTYVKFANYKQNLEKFSLKKEKKNKTK